MLRINEAKLTPFDLQVLTLIKLAPSKWSLSDRNMYCEELGLFTRSLLGMKPDPYMHENSSHHRKLSWRGQILLGREYKSMLSSPMNTSSPMVTTPVTSRRQGKMNPYSSGGLARNFPLGVVNPNPPPYQLPSGPNSSCTATSSAGIASPLAGLHTSNDLLYGKPFAHYAKHGMTPKEWHRVRQAYDCGLGDSVLTDELRQRLVKIADLD